MSINLKVKNNIFKSIGVFSCWVGILSSVSDPFSAFIGANYGLERGLIYVIFFLIGLTVFSALVQCINCGKHSFVGVSNKWEGIRRVFLYSFLNFNLCFNCHSKYNLEENLSEDEVSSRIKKEKIYSLILKMLAYGFLIYILIKPLLL